MPNSATRAQVVLLRRALRQLSDVTGAVRTNAALAAHKDAHEAWLAAFDDDERRLVVKHARGRDASITTFEEALTQYGTSLINELQAAGALE